MRYLALVFFWVCNMKLRRTPRHVYFEYPPGGISYTTIRDEFRKYLSPFVENVDDYCLHSLKSGGASNDGYKVIDLEVKDRHAGWKNPCSKRRYIERSQAEMRSVTRSIGIYYCFSSSSGGTEFVSRFPPRFPGFFPISWVFYKFFLASLTQLFCWCIAALFVLWITFAWYLEQALSSKWILFFCLFI